MALATALLLVDVINDLDFPGSEPLVRQAERMAPRLARLAARARRAAVPVVYVNDNFGRWQSDWHKVVDWCSREKSPGRRVVERLRPSAQDYFVLKPKHSGFFCTALDLLLRYLKARTLVITGIATDMCILFTANDAYMRDYRVMVPPDCVAAETRRRSKMALELIRDVVKGATPSSDRIRFSRSARRLRRSRP